MDSGHASREASETANWRKGHLRRRAFSNKAEVSIAFGHQRQMGAHIQAAIAQALTVLTAAAGLMLLFFCTCDHGQYVKPHGQPEESVEEYAAGQGERHLSGAEP